MYTEDERIEARQQAREQWLSEMQKVIDFYKRNGRWDDLLIDVDALMEKAEEL